MAETNDIAIKVSVDANGAIRVLDQLGNEIQKVNVSAGQTTTGFSNFQAKLVTLQSAVSLAKDAFKLASGAVSTVFDAIERGSAVDDVSTAFSRLTQAAGSTAAVFLNDLNAATGNTISNFDLMRKANESLRAGMKPEQFILLAQAARVLADETGDSLPNALNQLTTAFETGRVRSLQNALGVIGVKEAVDDLGGSLTTEQRILIARNALLEAASNKLQQTGTVTNDAADNVATFSKALSDARDKFVEAAARNEDLNNFLGDLSKIILSINFEPLISGLSKAAGAFSWFAKGGFVIFNDDFKEFERQLGKINATLAQDTPEATRAAVERFDELVKILNSGDVTKAFFTNIGPEMEKTRQKIEELAAKQGLLKKKTEETAAALGANTPKALVGASKKATDGLADVKREIDDLLGYDRFPKLTATVKDVFSKQATLSAEEFRVEVQNMASAAAKAGVPLEEIKRRIQEVGKAAEEAGQQSKKGFAQGFLDFGEGPTDAAMQQLGGDLQMVVANALADGITNGFSSETARVAARGAGAAIGASIGGPAGAAIGEALGSALFESFANVGKNAQGNRKALKTAAVLLSIPTAGASLLAIPFADRIFPGDSQGTEDRKKADAYFADLLDPARLSLVINGQLKELSDLVFSGNQLGGMLDALPAQAQAAFQGVGAAFEGLLGIAGDLGVNVGSVLANNLGGSLNNLQILMQSVGVSAEEMGTQIITAFEQGQLSALDAQNALNAVAQVTAQGIPDGVGLTVQAFDNLKAAGASGGRVAVDALKDLAVEAGELGLKTLPALIENLKASGKFTAEEIDQLFSALTSSGIRTLDDLKNATSQELIPVLAQLQTVEFPFQKEVQNLQSLIDKANELPKKIESSIVFNVKTNLDGNSQQLINAGANLNGVLPSRGEGIA